MSAPSKLVRAATRALVREPLDIPAPSAEDEARAVEAIARAIELNARRRRMRRAFGVGLAIAACAAGVLVVPRLLARHEPPMANPTAAPASIDANIHALSGAVVLLRQGHEVSIDEGSAVSAGDRVVAPAGGRAAMSLSTGTQLRVEGGSDFNVVELGAEQSFLLRSGAVHADVAKLGVDQRFFVRTADAEIEVRGTSFRVGVVAPAACGGGIMTRVSVSEGTVVVRARGAEDRVTAGQEWPADCVAQPIASAAAPSSAPQIAVASTNAQSVAPTPAPAIAASARVAPAALAATSSPPPVTPSELAEQNRAFGEASSAKRRGASREAIALYDSFLARYPTSQLAESAMVERMRLIAASDRAAGATAARDYLRRYPAGFARQEATALAQ
jgi:ferric-dicitrate binding protein FerR (iron transport regulator)